MAQVTPFLWFDTQAEEAARFYVQVFGGDSRVRRITLYGEAGPGPAGSVMSVEFTLRGRPFIAQNGGSQFPLCEAVSFAIECEDQAEVDHFWTHLSEGGQEVQCGWLEDRFGLSWQVNPRRLNELLADPDPTKAERVMRAMLTMVKLDLAALERAHRG